MYKAFPMSALTRYRLAYRTLGIGLLPHFNTIDRRNII